METYFRTILAVCVFSFSVASMYRTYTTIQEKRIQKAKTEQPYKIDTVYVLGKYGYNSSVKARTYIYGVDKSGNEYEKELDLLADSLSCTHLVFAERGDTIVVQGDKVIKNITLENLRSKLIKTR